MALVAAHDWPNDMESRQQRPHANTAPVQVQHDPSGQSAVAAAAAVQQSPVPYAQPQYGYPHPQQPQWNMGNMGMNGMNMNMAAQPGYFPPMQYYPQHYPHPQQQQQQQQQPMHQQGSPYGQPPQMFDPNAHFAQWAYQQMMFSNQQTHQLSVSPGVAPQQRARSGSHSGSSAGTPTSEYYQAPAPFGQTRYQAGTPPPLSSPQNSTSNSYQGFHPYRRPDRGDRRPHLEATSSTGSNGNSGSFQPPYARADAAGSTSSVNSSSSTSHRSRTNSGTSANGSVRPQHQHQHPHTQKHTPRQSSTSSSSSVPRSTSSSSTPSAPSARVPVPTTPAPRTARPSPLSQGSTLSVADRRKSRDDSDLAAMMSSTSIGLDGGQTSGPPMARSGLKGRLRRALSFNAAQTLREEEEEAAAAAAGSSGKKKEKAKDGETETDTDGASMATKKTKKSLRMFNSRFNASTDNISLSSTVSSASVMIRKLGSMGRLARRNSLAGITSLFKDKDKDKDKDGEEVDPKGKKLKGKGRKAEASVSLVTAELERSNDWSAPGMEGLSPAAKLARQHTLKSNAEAAARAKAQQEAQAAAAAAASATSAPGSGAAGGAPVPTTWEQNTATRHAAAMGVVREDGMRVVVEEDDSDEENAGTGPGSGMRRSEEQEHGSGSDEDSTWHGHGQEDDEEDVTIRLGGNRGILDEVGSGNGHEDDMDSTDEAWAVNIRRSVERARVPAKGILKNAGSYMQDAIIEGPSAPFAQRVRANSYDSVPTHANEAAGPLARMPSPDPDHIDGLHRHGSHRTGAKDLGGPPLLPPLSFDSPTSMTSSSTSSSLATDNASTGARSAVFNHPGLNSSEPTLSTMLTSPPTLTHRAATTPAKRLAFATNLSVYDTFPPNVYDRRSEPATWSRLTPALAQRIKEELNSYKMEEMEVHAASRVHTQFFV